MSRLTRTSNLSQNESQSTTSSSSRSTSMSHMSNVSQQPSISLIDCVEFKINGNINKNAILLADCDNDRKNELLVGTLGGELLIFKDDNTTPFAQVKDLGMIATIIVGDILNRNRNFITTLSVDGILNVFVFLNENTDGDSGSFNQEMMRRNSNFSLSSSNNNNNNTITNNTNPTAVNQPHKLQPVIDYEVLTNTNKLIRVHTQQIQANGMSALIADIDNDGLNEFIVALTDRVVRSYRILQYGDEIKLVGIHKWEFSDQIGSIALQKNVYPQQDTVIPPTKSDSTENDKDPKKEEKTEKDNKDEDDDDDDDDDDALEESTSLLTNYNILVSQYGGIYAKLSCFESYPDMSRIETNDEAELITKNLTPEYKNIAQNLMRNQQISAEIACDIKNGDGQSYLALATSDGLLVLMDDKSILWNVQLENKVLSLKALDVDGDGRDELIVCTWNGRTFIVNLDWRILSCHFEQPVSAFEAGHYHIGQKRHNAFVYSTFTNSIFLYYNIDFDFNRRFRSGSLIDYLKLNRPDIVLKAQTLIDRINSTRDPSLNPIKLDSRFVSALLYNQHTTQLPVGGSDNANSEQTLPRTLSFKIDDDSISEKDISEV